MATHTHAMTKKSGIYETNNNGEEGKYHYYNPDSSSGFIGKL